MLTCVEICAGAGGQALGLAMAGFVHVALVEYDGTVEGSLVIPKGYYVHHFYPEYMQLIAVSTDFTSGACTYNPESDTYTFDQDVSSTFDINLIDRTCHELTFLKTARKFDILATSN